MTSGYAQEKLYQALLCLVDEGPLPRRLADATPYLRLIREDDLAGDAKEELDQVLRDLDNKSLSIEDAQRAARSILSLFLDVSCGWKQEGKTA